MKGYNLPETTGPNDPEAPWNKTTDAPCVTCICCGVGGEMPLEDLEPWSAWICKDCLESIRIWDDAS